MFKEENLNFIQTRPTPTTIKIDIHLQPEVLQEKINALR